MWHVKHYQRQNACHRTYVCMRFFFLKKRRKEKLNTSKIEGGEDSVLMLITIFIAVESVFTRMIFWYTLLLWQWSDICLFDGNVPFLGYKHCFIYLNYFSKSKIWSYFIGWYTDLVMSIFRGLRVQLSFLGSFSVVFILFIPTLELYRIDQKYIVI